MANGVGDQYRKKSTILGDSDTVRWQQEKADRQRIRRRRAKELLIDRIPNSIKSKPFSGVEKEQILKGMSLLTIYQRRLRGCQTS